MGFWADLLGFGPSKEAVRLVEKYGPLMLKPDYSMVPETDSHGREFSNIIYTNISGVTHIHLNSDPKKEIPHLQNGEYLVLAPNPENPADPEAIRVLTYRYKQIGWIPRNCPDKKMIFRRLQEGYEVFCCVYKHGIANGYPWCEIRIATYATPFQPSLNDKTKAEKQEKLQKSMKLHLDAVKSAAQRLAGEEKEYVDAVKQIISDIPNSDRAVQYITYRDVDEYFFICCLDKTIVRLKLYGRKKYWLFPSHFAKFMREYPDSKFKCEPPTKKEGMNYCRLFITQASDLVEFGDIIRCVFLNQMNDKSAIYAGAFPELEDQINEML